MKLAEAIAQLAKQDAAFGALVTAQNANGIAGYLNERHPRPSVPDLPPLTLSAAYQVLRDFPADLAKTKDAPGWLVDRLENAMSQRDIPAVNEWLSTLATMLNFSQAAVTALTALIVAASPDPNWLYLPPNQSWAQSLGLGRVTAEQVAAALA